MFKYLAWFKTRSEGIGRILKVSIRGVLLLLQDGLFLIWFSGREEKQLRLSAVSKIVPGQRTVSGINALQSHLRFFFGS